MKRWNALIIGMVAAVVIFVALVNRRTFVPPNVEAQQLKTPAAVAANSRAPVLVELFTSEGCSSCPPADDLLLQLEKAQPVPGAEVIVLSQHVDYWNRLGWADPYSAAAFSARQADYARAFNRDGVYTPQMVVDGRAEFVGSNNARAREAIAAAAREPKATLSLRRDAASNDADASAVQLQVRVDNLPPITAGDTVEVWLAVTESDLRSNVTRGENSGRRLAHTAVVRQLSAIGTVPGGKNEAFTASPVVALARDWKRGNLRAVVFVQERGSRKVLGAIGTSLAGQ